jgi:hypothetical protein
MNHHLQAGARHFTPVALPVRLASQYSNTALAHYRTPVRLDLSVGNDERFKEDVTACAKLLDEVKPAKVDYRFSAYRGENHDSVRFASFPAGLYWVYRPSPSIR